MNSNLETCIFQYFYLIFFNFEQAGNFTFIRECFPKIKGDNITGFQANQSCFCIIIFCQCNRNFCFFIDNPILQWLDLRILKVETAGQSNPQGSDMKLMGIINTHQFKEAVLEQRELIMSKKNQSQTSSDSNDTDLMDVLKEIKGLLVDIKNK